VTKIKIKKSQEFFVHHLSYDGTCNRPVALWGSPQRRGQRHCRSPQERGELFLEDFTKRLGAKIALYPEKLKIGLLNMFRILKRAGH